MFSRNSDKEWETFGRRDPYYGVVSLDKFHKGKLTEDAVEEFFQSGRAHLDFIFDVIRRRLDPDFRPARALDFGCGVGRCLIPLADMCDQAIGIDVSPSMLDEGRQNCIRRKVENVEMMTSDDTLSNVKGPFDFIHSFIVFQHIVPKRGITIFRNMISLLSEKGVGALQFIYRRDVPRPVRILGTLRKKVPFLHNVLNVISRKPFAEPLMEKNCYDVNALLDILHRNGCPQVHIAFEGQGAIRSLILFFQKDTTAGIYDYEAFFSRRSEQEPQH